MSEGRFKITRNEYSFPVQTMQRVTPAYIFYLHIFATETNILYCMYNIDDGAGYSHMILSSTILL